MFAGMRPHQCTKCQKRFRFPSNLKSHNLTHTGKQMKKRFNYGGIAIFKAVGTLQKNFVTILFTIVHFF